MRTPRQHWTFVAAHIAFVIFALVFFCYLVPELVDYFQVAR